MKLFIAKEHWGTSLWNFIHNICIIDTPKEEINVDLSTPIVEKLKNIVNVIPCNECIEEYKQDLKTLDTIDLTKNMSLFYWSVDLHNKVNKKLKKPEISYSEAEKIWCNSYEFSF
jgi:hypothetical protein